MRVFGISDTTAMKYVYAAHPERRPPGRDSPQRRTHDCLATAGRDPGRSVRPLRPRSRHRADHRPRNLARPRRLRVLHPARRRDGGDRLGSRDQRARWRQAPKRGRGAQNAPTGSRPRRPGTRQSRRGHHRHRRALRRPVGQGHPPRLRTVPGKLKRTQPPWDVSGPGHARVPPAWPPGIGELARFGRGRHRHYVSGFCTAGRVATLQRPNPVVFRPKAQ
jgi:hypothetical protein